MASSNRFNGHTYVRVVHKKRERDREFECASLFLACSVKETASIAKATERLAFLPLAAAVWFVLSSKMAGNKKSTGGKKCDWMQLTGFPPLSLYAVCQLRFSLWGFLEIAKGERKLTDWSYQL